MDTRFTQLHADVLEVIAKGGPKGLVHNSQNSAVQVRIDKMYRPRKLDEFAPFTVPLGEILEQLMFDNSYIEPWNPAKGTRDVTSQIVRVTQAGEAALVEWANKPDAEKVKDSTPVDLKGDAMGAPILPTDSPLAARVNRGQRGKGGKGKGRVSPINPAIGTRSVLRPKGKPGALPRRK